MATKTLYVGNLPYSTSAEDLEAAFSAFGGTNGRIIPNRGFGFVDIEADQLDAACQAMDNTDLSGRVIRVNEAIPRGSGPREGGSRPYNDRPSHGGGGGGGGRSGFGDRGGSSRPGRGGKGGGGGGGKRY